MDKKSKKKNKLIASAELDLKQWEKAKRIGYNNVSLGIRRCIDEFKGEIPKEKK